MATRRHDRLQRLARDVADAPLRPDVVDAAFVQFRRTGSLPDADRLAAEVVQRALHPAASRAPADSEPSDLLSNIRRLARIVEEVQARNFQPARQDRVRRHLLKEALHHDTFVRLLARLALSRIAATGRDVTQPLYLDEDIGFPERGTVGMHVVDFPAAFVAPRNRAACEQVMTRWAAIRDQIPTDDRPWFDDLADAAALLRETGQQPTDALIREAIAVQHELRDLLLDRDDLPDTVDAPQTV